MSQLEALTTDTLQQLFGSETTVYRLPDGTLFSHDNRQVLLSVETLFGIYRALNHETGEAWKVVLKNCGYTWGKRFMDSLSRELTSRGKNMTEMTTAEFCRTVETYFAYHGWGVASIDLANAKDDGIVRVSINNSILVEALAEVSGPVDFLLTGMLRAVFEFISGRELDCVQVCCQRHSDSGACEFLVSAPERVAPLEEAESQVSVEHAIQQLQAA